MKKAFWNTVYSVTGQNSQLLDAVERCDVTEVHNLLKPSVDVDPNWSRRHGETALHMIMWSRHASSTEVTKMLLKRGAKPDSLDNLHETPLMKLCKNRPPEVVSEGEPDLVFEKLHLLLEYKASMEIPDKNGRTPLLVAVADCVVSHQRLVDLVAATGAMKNQGQVRTRQLKVKEERAEEYRVLYRQDLEFLTILLEAGAYTETPLPDGTTPLMYAAEKGEVQAAELLLRFGARTKNKDYTRTNAVQHANLGKRQVIEGEKRYGRLSFDQRDAWKAKFEEVIALLEDYMGDEESGSEDEGATVEDEEGESDEEEYQVSPSLLQNLMSPIGSKKARAAAAREKEAPKRTLGLDSPASSRDKLLDGVVLEEDSDGDIFGDYDKATAGYESPPSPRSPRLSPRARSRSPVSPRSTSPSSPRRTASPTRDGSIGHRGYVDDSAAPSDDRQRHHRRSSSGVANHRGDTEEVLELQARAWREQQERKAESASVKPAGKKALERRAKQNEDEAKDLLRQHMQKHERKISNHIDFTAAWTSDGEDTGKGRRSPPPVRSKSPERPASPREERGRQRVRIASPPESPRSVSPRERADTLATRAISPTRERAASPDRGRRAASPTRERPLSPVRSSSPPPLDQPPLLRQKNHVSREGLSRTGLVPEPESPMDELTDERQRFKDTLEQQLAKGRVPKEPAGHRASSPARAKSPQHDEDLVHGTLARAAPSNQRRAPSARNLRGMSGGDSVQKAGTSATRAASPPPLLGHHSESDDDDTGAGVGSAHIDGVKAHDIDKPGRKKYKDHDRTRQEQLLKAAGDADEHAVIILLDKYGTDPNYLHDRDGNSCLHLACSAGSPSSTNVVRRLLAAGAKKDHLNKKKEQPVHRAYRSISTQASPRIGLEKLHCLVRAGAKIDAKDSNNMSCLYLAIASAGLRWKKNGESSPEYREDYFVVETLLDLGANPNQTLNNGRTPLMWAVEKTDPCVTRLLISKGANLKATDRTHKTAQDVAAEVIIELQEDENPMYRNMSEDMKAAVHAGVWECNSILETAMAKR